MKKNSVCAGFLLPHPPVIIPEVGGDKAEQADSTLSAYKIIADEAEQLKPDTVVIISPHAPMFSDYIFMYNSPKLEGNFNQFGAPDAVFSYEQDGTLREEIERLMKSQGLPGGALSDEEKRRLKISNALDHGVLVPLYYFGSKYKDFKIVAMSCSALDIQSLYKLGTVIRDAAENVGRRVCIIASGDMSHKVNDKSPYGESPEGALFDRHVSNYIKNGNIPALLLLESGVRERAAECGYRSLVILCGAFDGEMPQTELLSYEAPFGIGYNVSKFVPSGKSVGSAFEDAFKKNDRVVENPYCHIARTALESFVKAKTIPKAEMFTNELEDDKLFRLKAGVFVSIKKFGELRGCIGTCEPTSQCVADEIIRNAISAGKRDPRFNPVEEQELDYLDYSVDVLSEPEAIDLKSELDPAVYGVIVRKGTNSGLLLPDLEGVNTIAQQLSIVCKKAGINPEQDYEISRFTVTRHNAKTAGRKG